LKQKNDFTWALSDSLPTYTDNYIGRRLEITDSMIVMNNHGWNKPAIFIYPINAQGEIDKNPIKVEYTSPGSATGSFSTKNSSMATDGKRIVVGSHDEVRTVNNVKYTYAGAAYLFEKINGTWTNTHQFVPDTLIAGDQYGSQVTIENNTIAIATQYHDFDPNNKNKMFDAGAVFMYNQDVNKNWTVQKIVNTPRASDYGFGMSVAVATPDILVGGYGRVTVFNRNKDCMDVSGGTAYLDVCGQCVFGTSPLKKETTVLENCILADLDDATSERQVASISPNPFDEHGFTIHGAEEAINIKLIDTKGHTLAEGNAQEITKHTKNLKSGIYVLHVQLGDHQVVYQKALKF
jgi:hypothetical protein